MDNGQSFKSRMKLVPRNNFILNSKMTSSGHSSRQGDLNLIKEDFLLHLERPTIVRNDRMGRFPIKLQGNNSLQFRRPIRA